MTLKLSSKYVSLKMEQELAFYVRDSRLFLATAFSHGSSYLPPHPKGAPNHLAAVSL